ncbi:hypothetical protein M407DRAFT_22072 [Tulasnella calospora MUT 4182]|uniref:Uncharacterized protein n=1 Tax=Tulasnella calospora MUT 4182 TaxID=1051891 RepID=A0A0C3QD62_9AGAM|nr:hypothetical protein M407DRAFT_22072 [Tulasnella calospora MUT 4182]
MPATTSTLISSPRQSQPARPQTPPADIDDSTPSSPTNTIPSSSSHSHQTQASSSLATETAASSPDVTSTALPYMTSSLEPPKGFVPAPSFSIARAPRYPGWRPDLEAGMGGLGTPTATTNKRTSVYMKPGGLGSQTSPPSTSPPFSPPAKENTASLPSLAAIIPPSPSPKFIPKKPLSANHLIRIANALGVQVPTPIGGAAGERSPSVPRSINGALSSPSTIRRPSSANSNRINQRGVVNTATRFLLYIVPPSHLGAELVGNAGLANQFRRGSLLPLHATLSSQLNAIAREYSLPSTQGLVVYLLDIKHDVLGDGGQSIGEEWLGPRIGDDAWRLLWTGMLRAERETFERTMALQRQAFSPSPSPAPTPGLPPSSSAPSDLANGDSSPAESVGSLPASSGEPSPQLAMNPPRSATLRPLLTEQLQQEAAQRASSPFFSHTRSETMRSESPSASSIKTTTSAVSPLLPSLPIVGKIEFDIDRTKATWYDNWAKRPRTRTASTVGRAIKDSDGAEGGNRSPLIPLQLGTIPPIVGSTTGKSPNRKLPPSPLLPVSPHLDVEAAQPSSNLLTPASAGFFGGNSSNSRSSTSLSSDIDEEDQDGMPRNSLLLGGQEHEKGEDGDGPGSASDDQSGVAGAVGYEPLADDSLEKEEDEDNRLSDNEGPFDEDPSPSSLSEDGDVPSDQEAQLHDRRDPLGDVFPSDGDTWSGIRTEMMDDTTGSPMSESRIHPDRAGYLGRTSEDSDFTEELPLPDSTADDFQEVLDLLNAKQQQSDLAVKLPTEDPSFEPEISAPSITALDQAPVSVLRSPIILDEHEQDSAEPEYLASPESTTSMESSRSRRPAPLILGPSDKIPSILEGLQPTPPGRHSLKLDTAFTDDPSTPQPQRNSTISSDGGEYGDEYAQEKEMKKQLDELERSISSLSPRELSTPLVTERSPAGRSRSGTPVHSLNGVNGPRFRSEALGVELAHKLAAGYTPSNSSRNASPHWPAVPFEKASPAFNSSPNSSMSTRTEQNSQTAMSEETRVRSHLQAEEEQLAASRKYRPPTPANKDGLPAESTPPLSVLTTMPPIPIAQRISSVSSPKSSSRFSADSTVSEENGRGTSVVGRSLRKLWRKSGAAAQASARLSAGAKQGAARNAGREDHPPPLPQTNPSAQPAGLRQELRPERPDSGQDPFFFDQQSPYPTFRAISPNTYQQPRYQDSQAARAPPPAPNPTANKTRSILKGARASPPAQEPLQVEATLENPSMLQTGGQKLSPSAFPRSASSRTSFDAEETTYRPSMDSGSPLTPRLSQFEIVSPRGKSFELEEDRRGQGNWPR